MQRALATLRRFAAYEGGLPLVWCVLTALVLVPVWHQRLLPMLDAPNHLALARAWHNYHDPSWRIAEFYTLRIRPVPYLVFYWFIHMALYVVSIETANKLFLSLYLILFPLSVLSLARALGKSPWLALGAFALAFSQCWIYGFASFLMGTALLFFDLSALIRYLQNGRRRDLALVFALSLVAYLCHLLPWFVFGCCAIGILLVYWRKWRRGLAAAAAMLPSLALAIYAIVDESYARAYLNGPDAFLARWDDFPTSVLHFPRRILELFPGRVDQLVLATIAATVIGFMIWQGVKQPDRDPVEQKLLPLMLILTGLLYLSLPFSMLEPVNWWFIAPRLPSMMGPLLLLLPAIRITERRRFLMIPLIAACALLPLKLARLYGSFSERNEPFMKLVERLPRGASTLVLMRRMLRNPRFEEESGDAASAGPVYWHFSSWPMALKGGFDPYLFNQGIPVQPHARFAAPNWTLADNFAFRDAPDYEYYLVRFTTPAFAAEPALLAVGQEGDWTLYKRIKKATEEP